MAKAMHIPPKGRVPAPLDTAAALAWRLLAIGALVVFTWRFAGHLLLVLVPLLVGLLLTALLQPLVRLLRRAHLPRAAAVWVTVLIGFAVLGLVGLFVTQRVSEQYPVLVDASAKLGDRLRNLLLSGPFHLNPDSLNNIGSTIAAWARTHTSSLASGVLTFGRTALEMLSAMVMTFFITFFLLWDGARVWDWLVRLFPTDLGPGIRGAGAAAWTTLSRYIHGTVIVALFHGTVVGTTLALLGAPLALPAAVLVFLGSFIPLIGAVLFGGLSVALAFVTVSPLAGLIMLIVLLVGNQIESHLLQPLVVGRYVRLHPLAIILALAAGTVLAGLVGAIFAVPLVASVNAGIGGWRQGRLAAEEADAEPAGAPTSEAEAAAQHAGERSAVEAMQPETPVLPSVSGPTPTRTPAPAPAPERASAGAPERIVGDGSERADGDVPDVPEQAAGAVPEPASGPR